MPSDDDRIPGYPMRGRTGRAGIMNRTPGLGSVDADAAQELKTVRLVCLFCREVRVIHVPADCDTPRDVLWECLRCQERWASRK